MGDTGDGTAYTKIQEVPHAIQVDDYSTTDVTYVGYAPPGTATSIAKWRIQKIDETTGTVVSWADGDTLYDNIWDNRVSLSYS